MRYSRPLLAAILSCISLLVDAAADITWPPRLLVATIGHQTILLLPESHIGLRSQYDRYFDLVIKPAYQASSRLLLERPDEIQLAQDLRYKSCVNEDASERQVDAAINAALPEVAPKTIWGLVPPPAPVEEFSRFMRTELLFDELYYKKVDLSQAPTEMPRQQLPLNITLGYAMHLLNDIPRPFTSVDTPQSMFRVYCAMEPAERNLLVTSLLQLRIQTTGPRNGEGRVKDVVAETNRAYREALSQAVLAIQGNNVISSVATATPEELGVARFLLAGRNREWMASLPALIADQRLPLMIIGAAHFPDTPAGSGLIHLLRDAGYHVSVVQDRNELMRLLQRLPQVPPHHAAVQSNDWIQENLKGQCVANGRLRLCGWGNERIMLSVTSTGTAQNALHVCTLRDTDWGRKSICSDVRVPSSLIDIERK